jgi:tRNA pseudouridine13 synthase
MAYEIKREPEDFIVEEITPDKKVLEIDKAYKFKESEGDQLICVLQKKRWDTNLAISEIAKRLYVSRKRIGFAGTKDKRAITTQRISLWKIKNAEKLRIKDMVLTPLEYSDKRIELGDLWGNRFTIKVYTKKRLKKLAKVPNFFGVQRFGDTRPITHLVGKEIVRENFEEAVRMYLAKVFPKESKEAKAARKKLAKDWDYAKALKYFPYGLRFERTLLGHLANNENDYIGALRKLPKFLKIMFVHAYQSYIFNEFLKEVIKKKAKYSKGQLFGYESKIENELEEKILKKERMEPKEFFVRSMPEMSSKGEKRMLFIDLKDLKVLERGKGYYVIRFSLPKGCYATTVIDYLFS